MKTTLRSWLALAMLLSSSGLAAAQDAAAQDDGMKPLVIASFKGFDELLNDLDYIGEVSDNPDMAAGIEGLLGLFTGGEGLEGLDKTKPWGLSVSSDGLEFQLLGFLPVNDVEKFLAIFNALGAGPQKEDEGLWKVEIPLLPIGALYFKQHGDWTYVSLSPDFLTKLPDDPIKLLGGLEKEHDIAAEVHIQNIPEIFRQLIIDQVRQGITAAMEQAPAADPQQAELTKKLVEQEFASLNSLLADVDVFKFGASIDAPNKKAVVDISTTYVEGSEGAKQAAATSESTSKYSGFLLPDATVALNIHQKLTKAEIEQAKNLVGEFQSQINAQIDANDQLSDEAIKQAVKDILGEFFVVLGGIFEDGDVDAGLALVGKGPFTFIAGGRNPKADNLRETLEKISKMLEEQVGFSGFQMNADEAKGVKFHSISIPNPGGEIGDQLSNLFGFDLELTFGTGDNVTMVAMGGGGVALLKKVLEQSEANAQVVLPPMQLTAAMAPLLKLLSEGEDVDPALSSLAVNVEEGKDKVRVVGTAIEKGMSYHIEAEEGLIKLLPIVISTVGLPGLGGP